MTVEPHLELSQTNDLLARARAGDRAARNDLLAHYRPQLVALLHARLPPHARSVEETQDLVQDVLRKAFEALDRFEDRGIGSFWMFLRTLAAHQLVDVLRRHQNERRRLPMSDDSQAAPSSPEPTPLADAAASELTDGFEQSLASMDERLRKAAVMRLELAVDYPTIAQECGYPSPDAARVAVTRAVATIARRMKRHA